MIQNYSLLKYFTQETRTVQSLIMIEGKNTYTIRADDYLKDLKVNEKIDKDGVWIGSAIPKMLKADIIDNNFEFEKGDKVYAHFGVINPGLDQSVSRQNFYIHNIEYSEDKKVITITAYDELKKAQNTQHNPIIYPCKVSEIITNIENSLDIKVSRDNILFQDFTISKEIFFGKDKTVIELINAIAQMSVTYAYMDNGTLYFSRPTKAFYNLEDKNIFKFRYKNYQKKYNAIVLSRQPQNDDVSLKVNDNQLEDIEIKLSNNPILDLDREFFITILLDIIKNIPEYYGVENLTIQSNPLLEVGDIITIRNKDVIIFEQTISMTRTKIISKIAEKTQTDYKKSKGVEDLAINTELYVDKVKNEIVAKIGDDIENKVIELKLDEEGITQRVSSKVEEKLSDPEVQKKFKGEKGEADYSKFRQEFSSELSLLSNQIAAKVEKNTYDAELGVIRTNVSDLNQDYQGIKIKIEEKGKYRNTFVGSDNFENYKLDTSYYFSTREDGSIEFGIPTSMNVPETYFLFPLDRLEYSNNGDTATLLVDRLFANANVNKIVFSLADKDKKVVSNAYVYSDNSKHYELTLTGKPEYLRVVIGRNNTNEAGTIRFYKETIAVVAGSVDNLTWDMTYINDSVTQYKFLKDEFLLSLGNLKTEIKGDINGLTLSGSKITLTGDTKVNGSFKIGANNLTEIGGFKITNNILEGGSGSSYIRLSGNPSYTSILVGGEDWNSAKFAVSSTGSMKAITGNIAGFKISGNTLEAGSGSGYVRIASGAGASPFMAGGNTWDTATFAVSSTGKLKATSASITSSTFGGTGTFTNGSYSGKSYGYGSFSSGSYTGSGYLASGSSIAGYNFTDNNGYLTLSRIYASSSISSRLFELGDGKIQGVYHSGARGYMYASLGTSGWSITNSDIRLKENISEMKNDTVKEIYNMPLIEYNYKSDETKTINYGVNANLLMKLLSEKFANSFLFKDMESGLYGAKYEMLTPHLIKTVQDLNKRLERLENE